MVNLIATVLFSFFVSSLYSTNSIQLLQEGESYYNNFQYRHAYESFKKALGENPNSIRAKMGLAKSAYELKKLSEARKLFESIIQANSDNKHAIKGLALVLTEEKNYTQALKVIQSILNKNPYDPLLAPVQVYIYLETKNIELAKIKINNLRSKLAKTKELDLLQATIYTKSKDYTLGKENWQKLKESYPSDPEIYFGTAENELILAERTNEKKEPIENSIAYLKTTLALNPFHVEARYLISKLLYWNESYSESISIAESLIKDFPNINKYRYLRTILLIKLNRSKDAENELNVMIKKDDQDMLSRFILEELAIQNYPEYSETRNELKKYRMNRYQSNKNQFYYEIADFELKRAFKLAPKNSEILKTFGEIYKSQKAHDSYYKILIQLRDLYPSDNSYQYKIENVYDILKNTLSYKKGYLEISNNSLTYNIEKFKPELFIFDFSVDQFLNDFPDLGFYLTKSFKFYLQSNENFSLVTETEEDKIKDQILTEYPKDPYDQGITYREEKLSYLDQGRGLDNKIQYALYGKVQKNKNQISVQVSLYDRLDEKQVTTIQENSDGKDSISEIVTRLTKKLNEVNPKKGTVLAVYSKEILVNCGLMEGVTQNSKFLIKTSKNSWEFTVKELDKHLSLLTPTKNGWFREISVGDHVTWNEKK